MDDPLARAAIEVVSAGGPLEVVGFASGETVTIPAGQGLALPGHTPTGSESGDLFTPDPIKGGAVAVLISTSDIEPIAQQRLDLLSADEPLVYAFPQANEIDLRHFRAAALQAAENDLRLVIVVGRVQDVGS